MKAIVLNNIEDNYRLAVEEVPTPVAGEGDVVVKLKAAALNRRDVMIASGSYPGTEVPKIIGSDGAGEVVAVGDGVADVSVGDEIIINPGLNWGDNPKVKSADFTILGMPYDGTFAEFVKIPVENVYPKPQHLTWEEAAALPLSGLTGYRALITKGKVQANENVFIPGAGGGVATYLIQFAKALGANVYVSSSQQEKLDFALKLGAQAGVNYKDADWENELLNQSQGIDLTIDSIGGESFKSFIHIGKLGSRIVSFGATRGPVPNLLLPTMTLKEMTLLGSTMGSPDDFKDMIDLVEQHQIKPVIGARYNLDETPKALEALSNGENFGKIVIRISE